MTKEIGLQYKAQREALGLTQQQAADQLGISRTSLSRLENGVRNITDEMKSKLDDIFSVNDSLKFSDLEVGDYVYVRDDLQHGHSYGNSRIYLEKMGSGLLKITSIRKDNTIELSENKSMGYTPEMLDLSRSMKREDYLKMNKRELFASESFLKLIDVAGRAYKDGVITKYELHEHGIIIGSLNTGRECDASNVIDWIKSLYTEEFIIEKMADELKIKSGAELTLSNGINCVYFDDGDRKLRYDGDFYPCNFLVLKGATVKQSKGAK